MIIPAIDILDGAVVRLRRGDFDDKILYHEDPQSLVKAYAESGVDWVHVVDLSGARNPADRQVDLIRRMMSDGSARLQVGGGIRTRDDVVELLYAGASRVVVGSVAIENPDAVIEWGRQFSFEKILPAIDVKSDQDGVFYPVTRGWTSRSPKRLEVILQKLAGGGYGEILMTDVGRDGMLNGPNVELYQRLSDDIPSLRYQASGGVAGIEDLRALAIPAVSGVIVGRALLDGLISLEEALEC